MCGSGRQIAGLHALTDGVINEIIAHATAAVYFDPEVDTIFEIGGQDAKYTYITNSVPSDYAMNEACSAGTGSFLEESALETLGVNMEEIAAIALKGRRPPNFNDQCAAFIASDIKNAIHEGVAHEDIVAGLVYSICMNYTNRVKGNRPGGRESLHAGRGVLQPGRAPGHGRPGRQTHHRPAGARPDGGLRCGAGGPEADRKRPAWPNSTSTSPPSPTARSSTANRSPAAAESREMRPALPDRRHRGGAAEIPVRRGLQPLLQPASQRALRCRPTRSGEFTPAARV